jgi:hypothetical protein
VTSELTPVSGRLVAGRYELLAVIGRGGAGTVWRAEDVLLQRQVAVKEVNLPPTLTEDERRVLRERVLREARAAAAVRHPVLVPVYDVVEDSDRPWLVLELIEARTLAAYVHEQPLTPAEAARIGIDLLAALCAVHRAGIQHRDVKPGNVLIEADGRPRLTDFGIASTAGDASLTGTGVLLGSPSYLPPERARGGPGGPESDLWSLAATLYTAVEGRPPYNGSHPLAVLTAVVDGRRRPTERAGDLEALLADLLDREPADRPDADEVRERLVAVAGPDLHRRILDPDRTPGVDLEPDTDQHQPDPPLPEPAPGPAERTAAFAPGSGGPAGRYARRRLILGAAAALLVLVVVGALVFSGRTSSTSAGQAGPGSSAGAGGPAVGPAPARLDATAATATTPGGWVRYTDSAGWSVAHPAGWKVTELSRSGVDFVQPGTGSYLHVDKTDRPPSSVSADWTAQETLLARRVSNFARVGLTPSDGADGTRAADWEFTFDLAGSPLHARDRGLVVDGTAYSLYWQTPAPAWASSAPTMDGLYNSFAAR